MTDPKAKLESLGEILGVDDSMPMERPDPRRGVGEILAGGGGDPNVDGAPADAPAQPPVDALPASRSTPPTLHPIKPAERPPQAASRGDAPQRTLRSSATLPAELVERLDVAKARRWTFPALVESAIEQQMIDEREAERTLGEFDDSTRTLKSFTLPVRTVELLEQRGTAWRMSRSQVLTVVLARELIRLSF